MVERKTRKISKRVREMQADPTTVWGKNPELEAFWSELASQKQIVVVYKDKSYKYVALPKRFTKKHTALMEGLKADENVIAILSSNPSQDAYEQYLYPMAKSKTVEYVLKHYTKYFKPILAGEKLRVPLS
jgi:hypothetical protein